MSQLEISEVAVSYGAVNAVRSFTASVKSGEIAVVLGANGAGKTSLLRAVAGSIPKRGRVAIDAIDISRKPAHSISRAGLALVPEGRRIFSPLSVRDNLLVGGYGVRDKLERNLRLEEMYERFPILYERRDRQAGLLSGGEQQMLAFGRALMSAPRIILLDEPSMGLAPVAVDNVMAIIDRIAGEGVGVLMVEQNAGVAARLATATIVMERGEVVESVQGGQVQSSLEMLSGFVEPVRASGTRRHVSASTDVVDGG